MSEKKRPENVKEEEPVLEYKITDLITLKLENNVTNIYINNQKFRQCKYLLISVSLDNIHQLNRIESIDQASELLDHSLDQIPERWRSDMIPPETEFWGHCSNLQAWVENDYDTRIIDSRLGFPFLEKLKENGDPKAKNVFKEEIAKKFKEGWIPTIEYLWEVGYLKDFTEEEQQFILKDVNQAILKALKNNHSFRRSNLLLNVLLEGGYLYLLEEGDKMQFQAVQELRKECLDILETQRDFRTYRDLVTLKFQYIEPHERRMFIESQKITLAMKNRKLSLEKIVKYLILKGYFGALTIEDIESHPKLQQLEALELTSFRTPYTLKVFPRGISHLKGLKTLKITKYPLKSIPDSIGNLAELQTLDLSENQLRYLPESIGGLKNLESLKLQKNQLEALPESIGDLFNLKELDISGNNLVELPSQITCLTLLQKLDIESNKLKQLKLEFSSLLSLESLKAANNQLLDIPISIGELKNLKNLDLYQNEISKIPKQICHLKSLQHFNIGRNKIIKIPDYVGNLIMLTKLSIGWNDIKQLPETIGKIHSLKRLDLCRIKIKSLPESFINLKNLEWIRLWDCTEYNIYNKRKLKAESVMEALIRDGIV